MSVRDRLIAGFAGVALPLGLLGLLALTSLSAANRRTHEIYQQRLVATVGLGQMIANLDQMRQMMVQDALLKYGTASATQNPKAPRAAVLSGGQAAARAQQHAIAVQLVTLDQAIERAMTRYEAQARAPRQRALLRAWPATWRAFLEARGAALAQPGSGRLLHALTVTLTDRLDAVGDLAYALMGAEQRQGYAVDQAQQTAFDSTLLFLGGGLALVAVCALVLAVTLTRSVGRLYDDAAARAVRDSLTGLLNHRAFLERLDAAVAQSPATPCAVLLVDVDNFKLFNDVYGHPAGDAVLRAAAALLRAGCRSGDAVARYGGDEFAALLPGADASAAHAAAERITTLTGAQPYVAPDGTLIPLRLSVGVACAPDEGRTRPEVLAVADAALYAAKHRGRPSAPAPADPAWPCALAPRAAADLLGDSPLGILEGLVAAVDAKDRYTREHSEDVTRLALLLADALALPPAERRALALAGPLHDVGKIAVPDRILRKPGALTDEEYAAIKRHVTYGVALIQGVLQDDAVVEAVAHHHERWDARGYPHGLPGPQTPLLGRIMQVADAVSAMTLDRPYRRGLPWSRVVEALRAGAGSQFDPALVETFIAAVRAEAASAAS